MIFLIVKPRIEQTTGGFYLEELSRLMNYISALLYELLNTKTILNWFFIRLNLPEIQAEIIETKNN